MTICPECDEPLIAAPDPEYYRRTGSYRYTISCACGERPATEADEEIINDASERYWLARWAPQ